MSEHNFFAELKRRNVYKVAVAYAVVAWLLIQAGSILFPIYEAPAWVLKVFVAIVALGFPVALVIAWAFEMTPEGMKRTEDVSPNEKFPQWSRGKFLALIVTVAVLAGGLLAFQLLRSKSASQTSDKSIAVLPFANQSGDTGQEYFSDGLTEELINGLGQIPELRVIGRNSSFYFKGKGGDSRGIGQALGVANLVEGSVRKSGDHVRIAVQLVNAADGSQRWSETYNRELKDIFAVQEEIAKAVAAQLRVKLLGDTTTVSSRPSNANLAAYNAFLQAQYHFEKSNAEAAAQAVSFLDEALRLDPNYADAYVLKARALYFIAIGEGVQGREKFEQARAAARAALALKPDLAGAHSAMGYINLFADWNIPAAEAELAAVHEKNVNVLNNLTNLRLIQGRLDECLALRQEVVRLEPLHAIFHLNLGNVLTRAGRLDEAEAAFHKALELQSELRGGHLYLAFIAIQRGDRDRALREAELEPPGLNHDAVIALSRFARGEQQEADTALRNLIEKAADRSPVRIATVYALRREADKMFEWLERAYTLHEPALISTLASNPFFTPYYSDPRLVALCNKIGMPVPK